ncbi:MAG TPA: hypothetical protein ACFYEM_02420, partial [Candidatus Hypogeohydataceae bacterium YC40]
KILINTKVIEVGHGFIVVSKRGEDTQRLEGFDSIVMSDLHKPNDSLVELLKKSIREVYVVGDAVQSRTCLEAVYEGANTVLNL